MNWCEKIHFSSFWWNLRKNSVEVLNRVIFTSCLFLSLRTWVKNVFEIFLMCSCAFHVIKIAFEMFFCKISKIRKFFTGLIDQIWFSTDRKCPNFRSKLSAWFDWCLIDAWLIEISQKSLLIDARFLTTDWNSKFSNFKVLTNQTLVCTILSFFFSSSWLLLELKKQKKQKQKKKKILFESKFQGFSFAHLLRLFYPFFFIELHLFMHK